MGISVISFERLRSAVALGGSRFYGLMPAIGRSIWRCGLWICRFRSLWGGGKAVITPSRLILVLKTLLLAVGYYATGLMGAFLADQPGFVAPIWPPAGIALCAALLLGWNAIPAIFLGSFFVTYGIPIEPLSGLADQQSVAIASAVALGASLQAMTGAFLVNRLVGFPTALTHPREVWRFLFLAGPVSCLIRPTFFTTSLWMEGMVQPAQYLFNWWTGWVGDTVGVIVIAPLILIWMVQPRDLWRDLWRRRRLSVTVPLVLVLVMITLFFLSATRWQQATAAGQFERRAHDLSEVIKKDLRVHLDVLYSVQSFIMASPKISRYTFADYVGPFLRRHPSILALAWNPYVPRRQRLYYEESGRKEGFEKFQITEIGANGRIVRASKRADYVPVSYVEPLAGNERALGYDVASDPVRFEALTRARDSGKPTATGWINLAHGTERHPAIVVFLPVYRDNRPTQSAKQRHRFLLGYATAVFRISDIVSVALKPFTHEELELTLGDTGTPPSERLNLLYSVREQKVEASTVTPKSGPISWSTSLDVAGRIWNLSFSPTPAFLAPNRSLQFWVTGAVGLLISALLCGYLLVATGHTYEVEKLVDQLQTQTSELTRANMVKEEFLSVMSHELRTPLAVMTGYLGVIQDGTLGDVNPKQKEILDKVFEQADDQLTMVNDILQVTLMESAKIGAERHLVNLPKFLETLKENYSSHGDKPVGLKWDYSVELPSIITDRTKLKQILQNLVNNAIKFTDRGEVSISARHFPGIKTVEFKVSDTGIGISKKALPFIFDKFWQGDSTDPRARGGVGLGLYIVKRFTELLKGEVRVNSTPGKGSTFTVKIPAIASFPSLDTEPSRDG